MGGVSQSRQRRSCLRLSRPRKNLQAKSQRRRNRRNGGGYRKRKRRDRCPQQRNSRLTRSRIQLLPQELARSMKSNLGPEKGARQTTRLEHRRDRDRLVAAERLNASGQCLRRTRRIPFRTMSRERSKRRDRLYPPPSRRTRMTALESAGLSTGSGRFNYLVHDRKPHSLKVRGRPAPTI